ncbi:MAG: hypothetical protein KatS3mg067_1390 [Thermosynechococcus sp.]|uniref:hormogonium polysaccharide biosynthesis protein HpsA n=1 Tax=Thermosynechococcus sp. TaxID=2814275 RepID=UPI00220FB4B9|nr:hormogonium polysaccharide biosynthesis protein HpsA [Thermosynechococcus sp.]BCX12452.1 MAG: hypothetical protein KatS3mg067_1390 [Thermosynechococcus sp.]
MKKPDRPLGLSKRQYRKLMRFIRHLMFQLQRWVRQRLTPLVGRRRQQGARLRWGRAGFVLPTAVIVLVVLSLTVAALMIRTLNRTTEVSGQRQEIQVMNATAPAIDRARTKLEYFFTQDPQRPNGVPGEDTIAQIMGNQGSFARTPDPYTLADEERIDLDGDGTLDNAWAFQPTPDSIVAYSILMKRPTDAQLNLSDDEKAKNLITRSRPMGITEVGNQCPNVGGGGNTVEVGWDEVTSAILRKNFQINAFVYENRNGGQALSTIEFVQERQMERGNKWGAWFRNDLEIFPGPTFRWNGAMHTEGSIFMTAGGDGFQAHLISSPRSCIYTRAASEITATEVVNPQTQQIEFQGQFMAGSLRDNNTTAGTVKIHSYREPPSPPYTDDDPPAAKNIVTFDKDRDSVKDGVNPAQVALNPVAILTEDKSRARGSDPTNLSHRDNNWNNQFYVVQGRFANKSQPKPYVDDTYRADDRYGPKPTYGKIGIPAGTMGDPIVDLPDKPLTRNVAPPDSSNKREDLGLDGYWERRARQEGLRIIVGERLELGDPLERPDSCPGGQRCNEFYQHRTLRDNLAAVQAAVVYHYKFNNNGQADPSIPDPFTDPYPGQNSGGYEPVACLAMTYHHGTRQTALNSITFFTPDPSLNIPFFQNGTPLFDFFRGIGTNGWEFELNDDPSNGFYSQLSNPTSALRQALQNLANNYGDPAGAFPPKQENSPNNTHPNPGTIKYGNFSNLRRALTQLTTVGNDVSKLSLADQSTLHTAGCMLGMLAYSVKQVEQLSQSSNANVKLASNYPLPDGGNQDLITFSNPNSAGSLLLDKLWLEVDTSLNNPMTTTAYPVLYQVFDPNDPSKTRLDVVNEIANLVQPRPDPGAFTVPTALAPSGSNPDRPDRRNQIIYYDGSQYQRYNIAFLDNALFNGREEMAVRVMDIDLDLLRRTSFGGDTWLPMGGIVYAFREDAVREDGIARPCLPGQNWMNTDPNNPHDPCLASNGISLKPVDFFADPLRRPNGFRLLNGNRLDRQGIPDEKNIAGLSFISDNPVYIQGDFNLHSTDGTASNLIEEFTDKLEANWSNFYSRSTLDSRFARPDKDTARPDQDTWRPAEILADAVTILSDNFCDGFAEHYFVGVLNPPISNLDNTDPRSCGSSGNRTSFLNANRPNPPLDPNDPQLVRESQNNDLLNIPLLNPSPSGPDQRPIYVNKNGQARGVSNYNSFNNDRSLIAAKDNTRVNAVIVSGIVPSRPNQAYGGMHNFPRFLENWSGKNLWIQGSFIQLNFSTQATGPYDQDQWEVPNDPTCWDVNTAFNCNAQGVELIKYYSPPNRRWGYDVALQLAPAGPVARRFITPGRQRTEYYTELRADDPYIQQLRCANRPASMGGGNIDPSASCSA